MKALVEEIYRDRKSFLHNGEPAVASDATTRAAQALLAYRRGDGPADLRARDLCRRLAEAIDNGGAVGPQNTSSPAFLTLALELCAARNPGVRVLVDELSAAVAPPTPPDPRGATQSVHVTGDSNVVITAGGDLHYMAPGPNFMAPESFLERWRKGRDPWTESGGGRQTRRPPEPPRGPPITILFAAASPEGMDQLRVGDEMREVREALDLSNGRHQFKLEPWPAVRARDFSRALLQLRPRMVHFSGHGMPETGELCFEDNAGCPVPANPQGLRGIFAGLGGAVECVVMNACYSHANAAVIAESVPYVIGNTAEIEDEVAIAFAVGFYQAIGDGMEIPEAHAWACAYMQTVGLDDLPPVLVRGSRGTGEERA
ncbi:MAG TPA: hypothetical protein VFS20_07135 [Longimicrobium sp.]|nr:hypothetical protein [Longimicrobium sp.]